MVAENIREILVIFEGLKSAPTDSDSECPTTEWRGVTVDHNDTSVCDVEAFDEIHADFFGCSVTIFWEERIVTVGIGRINTSPGDKGVVGDSERNTIAIFFFGEVVVCFVYDSFIFEDGIMRKMDPSGNFLSERSRRATKVVDCGDTFSVLMATICIGCECQNPNTKYQINDLNLNV
jgi:hypothetical protein